MNRRNAVLVIVLLCSVLLPASSSWALKVGIAVRPGTADISIVNTNAGDFYLHSLVMEFGRASHERRLMRVVAPERTEVVSMPFEFPGKPGSYVAVVTLRYLLDDKLFSLKQAQLVQVGEASLLPDSCTAESADMESEGDIIIASSSPSIWRLVLPDEVQITGDRLLTGKRVFSVRQTAIAEKRSYRFFAVAEGESGGKHSAAICAGTLTIGPGVQPQPPRRGRVPSRLLLAQGVLFSLLACAATAIGKRGRFSGALGKYSSRMALIGIAYYFLRHADEWFIRLSSLTGYQFVGRAAGVLTGYLGNTLSDFFTYFVDAYWFACLVLVFPFFYYFEREKPLSDDKYAALFGIFSSIIAGRRPVWNALCKLGLLGFFIRLVFIPYITSAALGYAFQGWKLMRFFRLDFYTFNTLALTLFYLLDDVVYSVGYTVEHSRLRNEIKTIEPTFLGWAVCLLCYPPFSALTPGIVDYAEFDFLHGYAEWVGTLMTALVTLLTGIFAWSSLALGLKASNLTNRGIVSSGPFRFCRHPAYASKVGVLMIQSAFFGTMSATVLIANVAVYFLRALTEERHLMRDPEYVSYAGRVRWRFIPKLL